MNYKYIRPGWTGQGARQIPVREKGPKQGLVISKSGILYFAETGTRLIKRAGREAYPTVG